MSKPPDEMSRRELIAELERLKNETVIATLEETEDGGLAERLRQLEEENRQVMRALIATKDKGEEEKVYRVVNTGGLSVGVYVTDYRGNKELKRFLEKGSFHLLTAKQIEELREFRPEVFSRGWLSVPDYLGPDPNVIVDVEEFIRTVDPAEADETIDAITSIDTLYRIFHAIEAHHYGDVVDDGRGGKTLEEKKLPLNLVVLREAVRQRLQTLAHVQIQ